MLLATAPTCTFVINKTKQKKPARSSAGHGVRGCRRRRTVRCPRDAGALHGMGSLGVPRWNGVRSARQIRGTLRAIIVMTVSAAQHRIASQRKAKPPHACVDQQAMAADPRRSSDIGVAHLRMLLRSSPRTATTRLRSCRSSIQPET